MKITCVCCGGLIVDNTDYIAGKAHLVPDQDLFDLCEAVGRGEVYDLVHQHTRTVWRCGECGALALDFREELAWFTPVNERARGEVLRSVRGEGWPGILRGHWYSSSSRGEVWWQTNAGSGFEHLTSREAVTVLYFSQLEAMQKKGILRSAFFQSDGEMVHVWEDPTLG